MKNFNLHDYSDIISLPHHTSEVHPRMSVIDRAAQFGAFSAVTGHKDAVNETARLTNIREELSEYVVEVLNSRLQYILDNIDSSPYVSITYFVPDELKDGGAYCTHTGNVRRIDEVNKIVIFEDGFEIFINDISDIQSDNLRF